MKAKLLFTDRSLPLILEALGYELDDKGYITSGGNKIHKSDILGFQKGIGIITK